MHERQWVMSIPSPKHYKSICLVPSHMYSFHLHYFHAVKTTLQTTNSIPLTWGGDFLSYICHILEPRKPKHGFDVTRVTLLTNHPRSLWRCFFYLLLIIRCKTTAQIYLLELLQSAAVTKTPSLRTSLLQPTHQTQTKGVYTRGFLFFFIFFTLFYFRDHKT